MLHGQQQLWVLLLACLLATTVWGAEFQVLNAETRLLREVYLLDADIDYEFSEASLEALENGVPLTINLEIEVLLQRDWLWDETVASLQQRFKLEYHALADQYVVTNLNSDELKSFPTRGTAIDFLGHIEDFPLLDHGLMEPDKKYYGRLRARLDIESLPAPLRPMAYLSGDWRLTSEWYVWPL